MQQAGWPDGGFNVLPLSNEDAGVLVTDDRIKLISFTGSAAVGWEIKKNAGKKKVILELGGNAGVIVHSDADLAYAAERCVAGGFAYAGQTCISVQRILVEQSVYGSSSTCSCGREGIEIGDPLDESTDLGPLIRESDAIRPAEWIQEAVRGGARILCGGTAQGLNARATVLTGTRPDMKVNCQEIFAPVVTVEPYDDFDRRCDRSIILPMDCRRNLHPRCQANFQAYEELEVGGVIAGDVPTFPHRSHALRRRQRFRTGPRRLALCD